MPNEKKVTVATIVTERILDMLSQGVIPWMRPYMVGPNAARGYEMPKGQEYTGINRILLPLPGEYLTRKMVEKYGGTIIDEKKFYIATFFKVEELTHTSDDGEAVVVDGRRRIFRYYKVWHISNTTGIKSKVSRARDTDAVVIDEDAESIIAAYRSFSGMDIVNDTVCGTPRYDFSDDTAYLPAREAYVNDESYYNDIFHQMCISALIGMSDNPSQFIAGAIADYSERKLVDLVAEIGAAMLMGRCGLDVQKVLRNDAALVQRWMRELKADSWLIISAARQAEKVVDHIMSQVIPTSENIFDFITRNNVSERIPAIA